MTVSNNLRDKQALVLRLIVAEVLARPGKGPLAPRFRLAFPDVRARARAQPRQAIEQSEPKEPTP